MVNYLHAYKPEIFPTWIRYVYTTKTQYIAYSNQVTFSSENTWNWTHTQTQNLTKTKFFSAKIIKDSPLYLCLLHCEYKILVGGGSLEVKFGSWNILFCRVLYPAYVTRSVRSTQFFLYTHIPKFYTQHAFSDSRSTEEKIHSLVSYICTAIQDNETE